MSDTTQQSLAGVAVVVTRPASQAEPLYQRLQALGADPIRFPTLEILAPRDPAAIVPVIERLERFDLAVFISANAVDLSLAAIRRFRAWPTAVERAVVGRATAAALAAQGLPADHCPSSDFSSEGLLALPRLQSLTGQHIVIFQGEGGRDVLERQLTARGGQVVSAVVYRRGCPSLNPAPVLQALQRASHGVALINSVQSLDNFITLMGQGDRLWQLPVVAISDRVCHYARMRGFRRVCTAPAASDEAMVAALLAWSPSGFQ